MAASALDFVPMGTNAETLPANFTERRFRRFREQTDVGLFLRLLGFDAGYGCFSDEVIDHFLYGRQKSGHLWSHTRIPGRTSGDFCALPFAPSHPKYPLRFTGAG